MALYFLFAPIIYAEDLPTPTPDTTPPVITLLGDATVSIQQGSTYQDAGATASDDADGDITSNITIVSAVDTAVPGNYNVTYNVSDAAGNTAIEVNRVVVVNAPDPVPVNIILRIYAGDTVLFDGFKTVTACAESPEANAPITLNGKCAVEQSGLSNTWTWNYTPSGWLDELGGHTTTSDFSKSWSYFHNLNYGSIALNQYILSSNEELLLTYNSYPLRISASKISGTVGDTITFKAEEQSTFDANYNSVWTPSSKATIILGTQSCITIIDGTCSIILNTAGLFKAIGSKALYVPSAELEIDITSPDVIITSNSGGGSGGTFTPPLFSVQNAVNYLVGAQSPDGSFGSDMYTDWAGIAIGAAGVVGDIQVNLIDYMVKHNTISALLTDNERRVMALLALGQNPYSFYGTDYVEAIIAGFDGSQFGDPLLVNDDIFALIPLKSAGYSSSDQIIAKDIAFVISKQKIDGSWEDSVDVTAAAVQALLPFNPAARVTDSLDRASAYLQSVQGDDGGFGSIYSTSWVAQAMSALGSSWTKNGHSITDYIATEQAPDGAALSLSEATQNRIWATSYAVPAALGKPWNEIMHAVAKPMAQTVSSVPLSSNEKKNIEIEPEAVVVENIQGILPTVEVLPLAANVNLEENNSSFLAALANNIMFFISVLTSVLQGWFDTLF